MLVPSLRSFGHRSMQYQQRVERSAWPVDISLVEGCRNVRLQHKLREGERNRKSAYIVLDVKYVMAQRVLTDCEEERTTPVGLLWSVKLRIEDVEGNVHMIPIARCDKVKIGASLLYKANVHFKQTFYLSR